MVEVDAVVGVVGAEGDGDLHGVDESVGMREALGLGQEGDRLRLIAFDLGDVENRKGSSEDPPGTEAFVAVIVIVGGRCRLLPEHDGRAALALADLGADRVPLAIGAPDAAGVANGLAAIQRATMLTPR